MLQSSLVTMSTHNVQPLVKEQMFLISPKEVLIQYHLESCIDTQTVNHSQLKELP